MRRRAGRIELRIKGWRVEANPRVVSEQAAIEAIRARFSSKYGEGDVKKYYPNQDVALEIPL